MKYSNFKQTYCLPFKCNIPSYTEEFIKNTSIVKRYIKFFKRFLFLIIKGQNSLEIDQISQQHKRILWINLSAPSLGDSLMDLSSRVMLNNKEITLFTDIKNASIYQRDNVFSRVVTNKSELEGDKYDLVIIDSYSTRSIRVKSDIQPKTPFIGMYGYYNGPEVNRVLFSFHRMNQVLNYLESEKEINSTARVIMNPASQVGIQPISKLLDKYIAIALGGEWEYRTYDKWLDVINGILARHNAPNIVLVGSDNAIKTANELMIVFNGKNIVNKAGQLTFVQTASVIKGSELLLCCDGGLMHAANAVGTPIVPLFARLTPEMQLTPSIISFPSYNKSNVKEISAECVLSQYDKACKLLGI